MKSKIFLFITINLFVLLLPHLLIAQEQISMGVAASGGGIMSNENHSIVNTIGQPAIGRSSNANYSISSGFWYETSPTTDLGEQELLPVKFNLKQNYPNPFNPTTVISYQLPVSSPVTLKIYDILGNEVATLVNEIKPAGNYEVEFDAGYLSSGVYFYSISAESFNQVKKMILLR
jgi:hypothetical protein